MGSKHTLDARRLLCPIPVIRLQDFVSGLPGGDVVELICTDPGARSDVPAWCRISGHEIVSINDCQEEIVIIVRLGKTDFDRG